ncbi:hypothetical protein PVAND_010866 [Polypedilum vanderplanki]|uniref:Secretory carrier-associated membrane protein n=1 Tax=Polypedilum vanderplanki TaxID=319348 RepID=A0A9J6CHK7_POLVA|nr:hypothetical protein PVAND_010866 [Polypedilum vanderplanki]
MSGFDENPFGDPFGDPSIQQVAKNTASNNQDLDNYDPFSQTPQLNNSTSAANQPATLETNPKLPAYSASGQQYQVNESANGSGVTQISTAELQRRQEELERKAAELERREAELLRNTNTNSIRRNNWPPLPDSFCVQPCFYHDIQIDIPSEFQSIVRKLYHLWIFYACIMSANIIGGLLLMLTQGIFVYFFLGLFYTVLFTPASFLCWYRPAYKAFKDDSSANFMLFFFVFFFQLIVMIVQTIGFPNGGTIGLLTAIGQFREGGVKGTLLGLICLSIAISFGLAAAGNLLMLTKIHAIYRSSGASMDKGMQEFQREFFRNQTVQQASADLARTAISSEMGRNRY